MRSGSSVILMALAAADTLTLAVRPTGLYLQKIHIIDLNDYLFTCKLQRFLKSVIGYYANWFIIVFTISRVIAVIATSHIALVSEIPDLLSKVSSLSIVRKTKDNFNLTSKL